MHGYSKPNELGIFLFLAFDKHFSHAFFNKEVSNRCSYRLNRTKHDQNAFNKITSKWFSPAQFFFYKQELFLLALIQL